MILLDANLLTYAYNESLPPHQKAWRWLEGVLSHPSPVRIPWATLLAFLRITTSQRAFQYPLTIDDAGALILEVLARPMVAILEPGECHWAILSDLLKAAQVRGPHVMDAHLAALAIEHGAASYATDRDFIWFPGLKVENPLETAG